MYALCDNCGTVRGEYVNSCPVCVLNAENVLLRKEIARLSENMHGLKEEGFELRKEGSVRKKVSRDVKVRRERDIGVDRKSDSPRQEDEREKDKVVDNRSADEYRVVEVRNNNFKMRISKVSQPVTCSNRFDCLPDEEGSESTNGNVEFSEGKTETLVIGAV